MRRHALLALAHGARTAGLVATFAGSLVAGVTLHASTPVFRRLAARLGNEAMEDLFEGKVRIGEVESLSIGATSRVRVREAEVVDPSGRRVIVANDVEASIDLARLLSSLARTGVPDVQLDDVRIGSTDVDLDLDPAGKPLIARAFAHATPRAPSAPEPAPAGAPPSAPAREPRVRIRKARLARGRIHGDLAPPILDGDVADLEARFDLEDNRTHIVLERGGVTLRSPKLPNQKLPVIGAATGELEIDLATTSLKGNARLEGSCGDVPVVASASIDGEQVEATIDVARSEPAVVATAFSDLPLKKPIEIHAHARGELPTIALDARVHAGESIADAKGEIDLREGNAFKLAIDAEHVDAQTFGADVPTDISGRITSEGTLSGGAGPLGTFRVYITEGAVGSERIPETTIEGRFESPRITAVVRARERGIDANGKITFDVPSKTATFDLQARSDSLRTLARAPNVLDGAASARAQGKIDLARGTIEATTTSSADDVSAHGFSAKHVAATGSVGGPLASPVLDVGFAGVDMKLRARGKSPLVYPSATGHAKVALAPSPRVLDVSIDLAQPGSSGMVTASAEGVRIENGIVEARGMRVTGLGEPLELDARVGNGQWNVRAKSAGVDLHEAARLTGIKELDILPEGTQAAVDIDLRQEPRGVDGHVDLVVRSDKGLAGNGSVVAEVHATMNRGKVVGSGRLAAEGFGQIEMTHAELDVPGRLDGASLRRGTGVVELRGAVDLSQGAALFAGENVERVAGIASFEARIERGDPNALPAIRGTVRTEGLEVAFSGEPPARTVLFSGVDVLSHFAWDGRTEDAEIAVLSWDRHGLLGNAGAKAKVPLAAWISGAKRLDSSALAALELDVVGDLPRRDVSTLPAFLGIPDLRGKVDAHVELSGKLGRPHVVVSAKARNLREDRRGTRGQPSFEPLDGTLEARWDGERAAVTFALDERQRRTRALPKRAAKGGLPSPPPPQKQPGHVRGLVLLSDMRMADLLEGKKPGELPWLASAEVEVENLALAGLPFSSGTTGTMTGRARIRDLNRDPSFEAKVHVDGFGAGGAKVQALDVTAGGRDQSLFAHAAILDEHGTEKTQGTFQVASKSLRMKGVSFGWDPAAPTRLDYAVQNGRLALIAPLVKGAISEIDGRVDGAGSATVDETSQVFEGGLALQDGRLYVNLLGEEITSLNATARFDRTGSFRIDDATGKMGSGEFRASVQGRMKGLQFMGADATIVASKDGVPISSEGATFAEATGEVKLSAAMSEDRNTLLVDVGVRRADVQLPDRDIQVLQALDPNPTVAIGVRRTNGELDTTAVRKNRGGTGKQSAAITKADGTDLVTRLDVVLGDSVHLEGRGLDVSLGGRTLVELADELKVTGRIDLRGGTVEVHGRRFTVDRGTVTFAEDGDPGNPTVVAAAYWDSPDRTRVWVELTGPLKGGKIALRSEPPYSPNEILSVLLFGRPDPNMAAAGSTPGKAGDASGATAVGTGFIAADINRALSEIDKDLDIETDTLSGNRTRTKLGKSFFDRRLKVQIGYAPGRTTYRDPDTAYLFLNWQFVPKWSLVATRGDRGTSILDVLFQHRY